MSLQGKPRIEKLAVQHALDDFDCGQPALNRFLKAFALSNQKAGSAQTYVGVLNDKLAGYYSLTVGEVVYDDAPDRLAKGLPRHPVPVIIIARLAADRRFQGMGVGAGLLADALQRVLAASEIAGVRGVIVHAKDERARSFYEHFGFVSFADRPFTLYQLLKDIRAARR